MVHPAPAARPHQTIAQGESGHENMSIILKPLLLSIPALIEQVKLGLYQVGAVVQANAAAAEKTPLPAMKFPPGPPLCGVANASWIQTTPPYPTWNRPSHTRSPARPSMRPDVAMDSVTIDVGGQSR